MTTQSDWGRAFEANLDEIVEAVASWDWVFDAWLMRPTTDRRTLQEFVRQEACSLRVRQPDEQLDAEREGDFFEITLQTN